MNGLERAVLDFIATWDHHKCGDCHLCIGTKCIESHPPPRLCDNPIHAWLWAIFREKRA